jgi:hypothetical protein
VGTIARHWGPPFPSWEKGITQPEWMGAIVAKPVDPVNADLVTRVIAAGQGYRPCRHAPRSCRDLSVSTRQPSYPSVQPFAATLCLADSRGSPPDKVGFSPPGIDSEDSTAMEGARARLASTGLRLDPEAPLRTRQPSAAPRWLAHCPAPPEPADGVRLIPTAAWGGVVHAPVVSPVTISL